MISTFPRNPQRDYCYDFQPELSHPEWLIFGEQVTTYTYFKNGANPLNGQRLSNGGVNAYTWDSNGSNLTRNGTPGNFTFGYSVDNRLSSISGAATATYTYDYQGRRASKTVSGTTTTYLYDGLNLLGETTGGTVTNYAFGSGIDEPLIVNKAGTISYFNADGLGSVAGTNNVAGTFDYNSIFDAWGSVRSESGTRTNSFTYTGRETGEAGLHFYRARFLDSPRGRFHQEDPLRTADMSTYQYAQNHPLSAIDPLGLWAIDIQQKLFSDRLDQIPKICLGFSKTACGIWRSETLECPCHCVGGLYVIEATAHVEVDIHVPTWDPGHKSFIHESLHVADIYDALRGYLSGLEALAFSDQASCDNFCRIERLTFRNKFSGWLDLTNRRRH